MVSNLVSVEDTVAGIAANLAATHAKVAELVKGFEAAEERFKEYRIKESDYRVNSELKMDEIKKMLSFLVQQTPGASAMATQVENTLPEAHTTPNQTPIHTEQPHEVGNLSPDSDGIAGGVVFVTTSLDTHFVMSLSFTETVADFKKRIEDSASHKKLGLRVNSLGIKYGGKYYSLDQPHIPVCVAFTGYEKRFKGYEKRWSLFVYASTDKVGGESNVRQKNSSGKHSSSKAKQNKSANEMETSTSSRKRRKSLNPTRDANVKALKKSVDPAIINDSDSTAAVPRQLEVNNGSLTSSNLNSISRDANKIFLNKSSQKKQTATNLKKAAAGEISGTKVKDLGKSSQEKSLLSTPGKREAEEVIEKEVSKKKQKKKDVAMKEARVKTEKKKVVKKQESSDDSSSSESEEEQKVVKGKVADAAKNGPVKIDVDESSDESESDDSSSDDDAPPKKVPAAVLKKATVGAKKKEETSEDSDSEDDSSEEESSHEDSDSDSDA